MSITSSDLKFYKAENEQRTSGCIPGYTEDTNIGLINISRQTLINDDFTLNLQNNRILLTKDPSESFIKDNPLIKNIFNSDEVTWKVRHEYVSKY